MTDSEILVQLRDIVRDNAVEDRDWESFDADTTIESLGFDSLSVLDLLYDLDNEFGVHLEAKEVLEVRTVGEIVEILKARGG